MVQHILFIPVYNIGVGRVGGGGEGEAQRPSQTTSSCLIVKVRQSPVKVGPSLFVGPCGEITKALLHIPVKLPQVFRLRPVAALQFQEL